MEKLSAAAPMKYMMTAPGPVGDVKEAGSPPQGADAFVASAPGNAAPPQLLKALTAAGPAQAHLQKPDTAVIYEPGANGTFMSTRKFPCDSVANVVEVKDEKGISHHFYISRDGHVINCMGPGGDLEMEIPLPGRERVGQMLYSEKEKALFIRTGNGLHRVDPEKGAITAGKPFGSFGFDRSIGFNHEGDLVLGAEEKLATLDGQFREKSAVNLGFKPDTIEELPGGWLFCLDDAYPSKIAVFSKDGKKVLEENDGRLHSTILGEDSKVYFIGTCGIGREKPRELVRFDPATGEVLRIKGTKDADVIIPLKNGSMLVFDDRLADPRFITYDHEGRVQSNFSIGQKGYARQFYLNDDESKAYLVFDCDSAQERHLYEVNLKEEPGLGRKLTGSLLSTGVKMKPRLLYAETADQREMVPAILKDGRIVVFGNDTIHLLDNTGKEIRQYATSAELLKDLGPGAGTVNQAAVPVRPG